MSYPIALRGPHWDSTNQAYNRSNLLLSQCVHLPISPGSWNGLALTPKQTSQPLQVRRFFREGSMAATPAGSQRGRREHGKRGAWEEMDKEREIHWVGTRIVRHFAVRALMARTSWEVADSPQCRWDLLVAIQAAWRTLRLKGAFARSMTSCLSMTMFLSIQTGGLLEGIHALGDCNTDSIGLVCSSGQLASGTQSIGPLNQICLLGRQIAGRPPRSPA